MKKYCDVSGVISDAIGAYIDDVRTGAFPAKEHSFTIKDDALDEVVAALKK